MDPVAKEIASRYLPGIPQFGVTTPELLDAVLRKKNLTIVLVDGRKLTIDTNFPPAAAIDEDDETDDETDAETETPAQSQPRKKGRSKK